MTSANALLFCPVSMAIATAQEKEESPRELRLIGCEGSKKVIRFAKSLKIAIRARPIFYCYTPTAF